MEESGTFRYFPGTLSVPRITVRAMTSNLVEWVNNQLVQSDLPDEVALLILAALEGDTELDAYLADGVEVERPVPAADTPAIEANGVVLTSVTVEGFRGIGSAARLDIAPKPGLTIVTGRNGSGKSSLSEALELVLTGRNYRWENRSADWIEQWRNLHHATARVSVSLVEEGVGPIEVSASWADGETSVHQRTVTTQVHGQPQIVGTDHLGWSTALAQFRPILSYDELGGMLDGRQSELYDALASILGVEELTHAVKRLKTRHTDRKSPGATLATDRKQLQQRAAASDDERAVRAAALLKKTAPDVPALRALVTGADQVVDNGVVQGMRSLLALRTPDRAEVEKAVVRLTTARNVLADAGAAISQRNRARLQLLEQGVAFHATHGDQSCPVCRTGELDAAWLATSQGLVKQERAQFADVEQAHHDFDLAFGALRRHVTTAPMPLVTAPVPSLQAALDDTRDAWTAWSTLNVTIDAAGADGLAAHVAAHLEPLLVAVATLKAQAAAEVAALDDQWQPLATAIGAWCDDATVWAEQEPTVKNLLAAHKWLTDNDLRLKNERLAPIEAGAREAWAALRQESNVELGSLELAGRTNRRHVKVSGAIDGEAVDSFAVFSQGELHALTLSLFLPRATLAESPFRFVVLDDPVQAMDPAKVDGLVELLGELARTRQVVVFSHDDRLAAALRRSSYDATILEVTRAAESKVDVTITQDPSRRYLKDAHGLIMEWRNGKLTEDDLRRTLPGLYRFAIEAAAKDRYFATRLAAGDSLHDLERVWADTDRTKRRVHLAVLGSDAPDHVVGQWGALPHRKAALGLAAGGFHRGMHHWIDPDDAHHNAKRLVDDIRQGAS